MEKIGIIGSGTWGTAIAVLLVNNGHEVTLWSAIPAEIEEMAKTRTHRNLPGVTLPEGLIYTAKGIGEYSRYNDTDHQRGAPDG